MDYPNYADLCLMDMTNENDNSTTQNLSGISNTSLCEWTFSPPVISMAYLKLVSVFKWAVPVIISLGIPLNTLSFYVFTSTKLKNTSSSRYLAAISVVDTFYLVTKLMVDLALYHQVPVYTIHGACQLIFYINNMSIFLSYWYVTTLVVDKFIGIYWPVRKSAYCTVFRAKCVIVSFVVMAIVFYHYITWTYGYDEALKLCLPYRESPLLEAYHRMNMMDYVLVAILPFSCYICIIHCNMHKSVEVLQSIPWTWTESNIQLSKSMSAKGI